MIQSFLIPFSIFLVLMALAYQGFLQALKAPRLKRYTLIVMVPVAVLLTFFELNSETVPQTVVWLSEITVGSEVVSNLSQNPSLLWVSYLVGVLVMLFWHLVGAAKLFKMTAGAQLMNKEEIPYWYSPEIPHVFSFGNRIYSGIENPDRDILLHEQEHINQHHMVDQIVCVLLKTFLWFHPAVYFIGKWSADNNEVLVDETLTTRGTNKQSYIQLLKVEAVSKIYPEWVTPFSQMKQLKNRIKMMNQKEESRKAMKLTSLATAMLLLAAPMVNSSCNKGAVVEQVTGSKVEQNPKTEALQVAEVMPEYPGGKEAMFSYMVESMKYPKSAEKESKEGKVFVSFVIDKSGKVVDVEVAKGFDAQCDAEALRVVKEMPDWTPGKQEGKNVAVKMMLPISFALQ